MAAGFKVGPLWYRVGHGEFLHSFFSTIAYNLEGGAWGSKYPILMNKLYSDFIPIELLEEALNEAKEIQFELGKFPPNKVVWDLEDLSKQPPWGDNISTDITSLKNYFVTSDGKDLIEMLLKAINVAIQVKKTVEIKSI